MSITKQTPKIAESGRFCQSRSRKFQSFRQFDKRADRDIIFNVRDSAQKSRDLKMIATVCAISIPVTTVIVFSLLRWDQARLRAPENSPTAELQQLPSATPRPQFDEAALRQELLDQSRRMSIDAASGVATGTLETVQKALDEKRAEERAFAVESAIQAFVNNLDKEFPEITKDQLDQVATLVRETEQQRQTIQEKWAKLPPNEWDVPAYHEEKVALDKALDQKILQILPQEWQAAYLDWRMVGGSYLQYQTSTKEP
jgi:hypothetical protein